MGLAASVSADPNKRYDPNTRSESSRFLLADTLRTSGAFDDANTLPQSAALGV
jgi:hypothetical protein